MSEQLSAIQPVSITIKSPQFENMLEKDICNTKWRMERQGNKIHQEEFATFNSDYTITSKDWGVPETKWKYAGPNQIGFENENVCIILFNKRSLIFIHNGEVEYTGRRVF